MFAKVVRRLINILNIIFRLLDYLKYKYALEKFIKNNEYSKKHTNNKSILIIAGRGMNTLWAQIWTFLSLPFLVRGYNILALSNRSSFFVNLYFKIINIHILFIDDIISKDAISKPKSLNSLCSFEDYRRYYYKIMPVGQIALSTYSRSLCTGIIDIDDVTTKKFIDNWIGTLISFYEVCDKLFRDYNVEAIYTAEIFLEEYGAVYYCAIANKVNIIRTVSTVRDDSIIVQKLSQDNDRIHHASVSRSTFEKIKIENWTEKQEEELRQNFSDRYGDKWHRSKRNQPDTVFMSPEEMKSKYMVPDGKKIVIVYSHILYDTLFFFGTDLFSDYSEWLVETVRAACENVQVEWFIKVHPSNIWRGELNSMLKGKYEEERLLQKHLGKLPSHIRIVPANNDGISPYSWFCFGDYGITVRGTSGLEMAALGKTVICAGTGRYEGNGFTVDPADKLEYLDLLKNIHNIQVLTEEQKILAKKYAHAIFLRKPFRLDSLTPILRSGAKKVVASDDIVYIPTKWAGCDLTVLSRWIDDTGSQDLIKGIDYDI